MIRFVGSRSAGVRCRVVLRVAFLPLSLALAVLAVSQPPLQAQEQRAHPALRPFASDSALAAYLVASMPPEPAVAPCVPPMVHHAVSAGAPGADTLRVAVTGRVADPYGAGVAGAQVVLGGGDAAAVTDSAGGFSVRIGRESWPAARGARLLAQSIGYVPSWVDLTLGPGDSVEVQLVLCSRGIEVSGVTVTEQAAVVPPEGITNVQTAGVDEGGIVKLAGHFLVVLRRGRLFTVDIAGAPRPVAAVDAFAPGIDPEGSWYDEMLVAGDRVVVIGYSYGRGGTELGLFRLGGDGSLSWVGTWHLRSNDYYSSDDYASRLVGSRLYLYAPLYLRRDKAHPLGALPGLRRWVPGGQGGSFTPIWTARRVFLPARPVEPGDVALHTLIACDLAAAELACEATVVVGPGSRSVYASATAEYVWMRSAHAAGDSSDAVVVRIPFDGSAPTAIGARGSPIDQFSFLESADGYLNVLVRSEAWGDAMWAATRNRGEAALVRIPLGRFGDGGTAAPDDWYRPLPMTADRPVTNRFVGDWLLYGAGGGWGPPDTGPSDLFGARWRDGILRAVTLSHPVDRIEAMGGDAVVVGSTPHDLRFSGIHLDDGFTAVQRFTLPGAAEGETRSHGFFYRSDGARRGVIGLPVVEGGRPRWKQLFRGSASVLYLRNDGAHFEDLGRLEARGGGSADDGCVASCVDWYGNARPLFIGRRVFALLGYELVEGREGGGRIREVGRVSFAPSPGRRGR
jgi:hypothetical protein